MTLLSKYVKADAFSYPSLISSIIAFQNVLHSQHCCKGSYSYSLLLQSVKLFEIFGLQMLILKLITHFKAFNLTKVTLQLLFIYSVLSVLYKPPIIELYYFTIAKLYQARLIFGLHGDNRLIMEHV